MSLSAPPPAQLASQRSSAAPASSSASALSSPVPPLFQHMHAAFRGEVLEACKLMDQGRKGYITARELKYVFVCVFGFKPTKLEIHNMLSGDPTTERGILTYDQVYSIVQRKQLYQTSDHILRSLFHALDTQSRGFLVFDDLLAAATPAATASASSSSSSAPLSPSVPLTTLLTVFGEADLDRNAKIGFSEFERIMKFAGTNSAKAMATNNRSNTAMPLQR